MKSEVRAYDSSHHRSRVDSRKFDNISNESKLHQLVVILILNSTSGLHVLEVCPQEVFRVYLLCFESVSLYVSCVIYRKFSTYQHEYLSIRPKFEETDSLCVPEMSWRLPLPTWHSEKLVLQHLLVSDLAVFPHFEPVLRTGRFAQDTQMREVSSSSLRTCRMDE